MKRFAYVLALVSLLLTMAAPAWGAPNITANAQVVNEGRVRPSGWTTVLVDLNNQGAELSGELIVGANQMGSAENRPEFVVPVTLPAGGKKRVPVTIPLQGVGQVLVRFESGGAKLYEKALDLTMLPSESLLIGLLSDDELGIPALGNLSGGNQAGPAQVTRLDASTFPTRTALLSSFDVIAISRFDTATLSAVQLQALEGWVGKGGTLLLAGGPEWQRSLKPLPASLVPVQVTGTGQADIAPLTALSDKPLSGQAPVSQATLLRGQALASSGSVPLLVSDAVGLGKVLYLAVDPGLAPMATWQGQPALFGRIIRSNRQGNDCVGCYENRFENALRQIPGLGLPSLGLVVGLLGSYLLLIGPANYLILKRFDRRALAWATVPALSIAFVAAIYVVGFRGRSAMLSHMITVTEVSPGSKAATQSAYVGVYAPSRSKLEVSLPGNGLVSPLFIWQGGPSQEQGTRIIYGEKTTVQLLDMNNYSMRGFSVEQDVSVSGGIELVDAAVDADGNLTARIVNRLDQPLSDVTIVTGSDAKRIGDLAPGAQSEVITLSLADAGTGNPSRDFMMARNVLFGITRSPDQARRNQVMEGVLLPDNARYATRDIRVAAFTPQPVTPVNLPDLGRLVEGTNLVHATLPIPVDFAAGDLPPGVVQGVLTDGAAWGESPMGYSIEPGLYTFSLQLPPIDKAKVAEMRLVLQSMQGGPYNVAVKHQKEGQWVDLKSERSQSLPNWQDFVAPADLIEIRIDASTHMEIAPPTVSVKGVGR